MVRRVSRLGRIYVDGASRRHPVGQKKSELGIKKSNRKIDFAGSQKAFEDQAVSVKRTCEASASLDGSSRDWDNLNPHFCRTRIEATLCFATPA
jgi:hypothetical protein